MGVFTVVSAMHPVVCPAVAGGTFKLEGFVFKSVGIAGTGDALGQQGAFGSGAGLSCAAGNDCAVYRFGAPDGAAAGGQPDTGNRTGRGGSVAGTSWKQRPDPEYGGHRGSACAGGGVASAAFETFNPLSGVPGKRGALQPVSDSRVVEAVGAVAKGFYFLLAAAGSAVVLFALSIAVVCASTNAAYFAG